MDHHQQGGEASFHDEHRYAYRNLMRSVRKQMVLKLNRMDVHGIGMKRQ